VPTAAERGSRRPRPCDGQNRIASITFARTAMIAGSSPATAPTAVAASRPSTAAATGKRGDVQVAGDRHQCGAGLGGHLLQQGHHRRAGLDVEGAGGLVRQHHPGTTLQRAGDGDPLLLTARQLLRRRLGPGGEADPVEHLQRATSALVVRLAAGVQQRCRHVLPRGPTGQQVELLEDEAERLTAQAGPPPGAQPVGRLAVEQVLPRRRAVEETQQVEQRRLPRPRPPDDRHVFLRCHVEATPVRMWSRFPSGSRTSRLTPRRPGGQPSAWGGHGYGACIPRMRVTRGSAAVGCQGSAGPLRA
jgi:hypothetical protein